MRPSEDKTLTREIAPRREGALRRFKPAQLRDFNLCGCTFGFIIMTGNEALNVERCDDCKVFETDEEAAEFAFDLLADLQERKMKGKRP